MPRRLHERFQNSHRAATKAIRQAQNGEKVSALSNFCRGLQNIVLATKDASEANWGLHFERVQLKCASRKGIVACEFTVEKIEARWNTAISPRLSTLAVKTPNAETMFRVKQNKHRQTKRCRKNICNYCYIGVSVCFLFFSQVLYANASSAAPHGRSEDRKGKLHDLPYFTTCNLHVFHVQVFFEPFRRLGLLVSVRS